MQACRNGQRRGRDRRNRALGTFLTTRLKYRLGHFLDEQWNAIGALHDVLPYAREQRLVASNTVDHGSDVALPQPIKGECCDVRLSDPRRLKFGPTRDDQQHAKGSYPSTTRPIASRLVGSAQCASSKIISTGLR